MAEAPSKTTVPAQPKEAMKKAPVPQAWHPFESLHREVDRLFDDFGRDFWRSPFRSSALDIAPAWRRDFNFATPAVDIAEKDNAFEITADLPGLDEKNVEVRLVNGNISIRGEKKEEREDKQKDYYLKERNFGSFERSFALPDGVDVDKIEATFKKGVLTVTLPKKPEAQKPTKSINIKAA